MGVVPSPQSAGVRGFARPLESVKGGGDLLQSGAIEKDDVGKAGGFSNVAVVDV